MNLGPKRVAYIKPTRTGEEVLAIIFHWVFEQCLTMICFYFIGVFLTHCLRLCCRQVSFTQIPYHTVVERSHWQDEVCVKNIVLIYFSLAYE